MVTEPAPSPPPTPPALDARMRRYMRARALRRGISEALSAGVRVAYRGRLDVRRHSIIIPESSLSPWRYDEQFKAVLASIKGFTLVDEMRLYELWSLTGQLADAPGDILEVGVWRGGSGCLVAKRSMQLGSDARVVLCDTFSGVVKAGDEDPIYTGGEHEDTSADLVLDLARSLGLDNVEVLQGIFPDETGTSIEDRTFKLCHLDVDVYGSTRDAAGWLWPRLQPGGVIVVDDFGGEGMDGVVQAVDEIVQGKPCRMVHNLNGHAVIVKIGD